MQQQSNLDQIADNQIVDDRQENIDETKKNVFLFVGVLSKGSYTDRRAGIREGWSDQANQLTDCIVRFFLLDNETSEQTVQEELAQHTDMITVQLSPQQLQLLQQKQQENNATIKNVGYRSLNIKVVKLFQHALKFYQARFVLKTDDDSYINMPQLLIRLRTFCSSEECENERLYIGRRQVNSLIVSDVKHKWYDPEYTKNTGLDMYPPYMLGGGYVLSRALLQELMFLYERGSLIEIPNEDAMIGTWLAATKHQSVHLETFLTGGYACCVGAGVIKSDIPVQNYTDWKSRARKFNSQIVQRLCPLNREDQWLILHKIAYSQKLKVFGYLFESCEFVDDFVQECYDAVEEVVQCDYDLEFFDLNLFSKQYNQLYDEFKNLQFGDRYQIQQQIKNLIRPFTFNDTNQLFEKIRKENLGKNFTDVGKFEEKNKICSQIIKNGTVLTCEQQQQLNQEDNDEV